MWMIVPILYVFILLNNLGISFPFLEIPTISNIPNLHWRFHFFFYYLLFLSAAFHNKFYIWARNGLIRSNLNLIISFPFTTYLNKRSNIYFLVIYANYFLASYLNEMMSWWHSESDLSIKLTSLQAHLFQLFIEYINQSKMSGVFY